jgi:hypothetical protein
MGLCGRQPTLATGSNFRTARNPTFFRSGRSGSEIRQKPAILFATKTWKRFGAASSNALQALVAKRGGNLSIETAHPAGQYPLKIIRGACPITEEDTERQLRSLPR